MTIQEYLSEIYKLFATGLAGEHSYRPALQQLLSTLLPKLTVLNEPTREEYGIPDYILMRNDIPVGFIEAKNIGDKDIDGNKEHKEQFDRYRSSLDNIVFTDYLDFHFYEKGELTNRVRIAEAVDNKILPKEDSFEKFINLIEHFGNAVPQQITRASQLIKIMAGKTRLLADVIKKVLIKEDDEDGTLKGQMNAFIKYLIQDITPKEFSDVYAQTITYGFFAARIYDPTPDTFSRAEAATLIPKSNPFLRQLFQYIAGYDLDERIRWIVDDLAEAFRATNMPKILSKFGKSSERKDPIIHFYENFLSAYDPQKRKNRGVWYTPPAIVSFIVHAIDDILQSEFDIPMGLADTKEIPVEYNIDTTDNKLSKHNERKDKVPVHRVQILDPATGTGTFLAEIVSQIYAKLKEQPALWQIYVDKHLLRRLNGFELLMAPYAIAHLKIDWLLKETGYQNLNNKRLRIYLTNSLEKYHDSPKNIFAKFLEDEANGANLIKRNKPVMIILGNPPYSGISQNNNTWISGLIDNYKYTAGVYFNEKKHWLNDDYVKFIRLGQYYIDKNKEGVLAYVNNHGFLDNPTFRSMRWNLLKSFDKIYIIDLHGNLKSKETCPDGSKDENVFNIQKGVSVNIFIKTGKKPEGDLAEVFHYDLWGKRKEKFDFLTDNSLATILFKKITPTDPFYFFTPKDETGQSEYAEGIGLNDLMPTNATGVVTARDSLVIDQDRTILLQRIKEFADSSKSDDEIRKRFFPNHKGGKYLSGDSRGWQLSSARNNIRNFAHENKIHKISYRPFDNRYIYYSNEMVDWGRERVFNNLLHNDNLGLVYSRQAITNNWSHIQIVNTIIDNRIHYSSKGISLCSPLYLYESDANKTRQPNLNMEIVNKIAEKIRLTFEFEKSDDTDKFAPIDLLDYVYAVLHSNSYREKYKEFLKTDFPRVPYPTSADEFRRLARLGNELRQLHLMEHKSLTRITTEYLYKGNGDNAINKIRWEPLNTHDGRVWINDTQYFDNIPTAAWQFYIGGYQPAQKWLKDRLGKKLEFDELCHYQQIIKALVMTEEIMEKIDN